MLLSKLAHALHDFAPRYERTAAGTNVFACQPLAMGAAEQEGVLYVGALSQARALLAENKDAAALPLLCIEDAPFTPGEFARMLLVAAGTGLDELMQAAVHALAAQAHLQQGMQRLIVAMNSNRGLQHLVDEACDVLGNPLSVIDISYRILAQSTEGFDDRPDIQQQRTAGYLMPENLADLRDDGVYRKLRETRYPYISTQKRFDTPWLHTLVFVQGIEVASVSLMEKKRPISKDDIELFHFFSGLVSMELQKSEFFKVNRGFMHSFLLSELLEGNIVDTGVIDLRLQQLDWRPTPFLYVLALTGRTGPLSGNQMDLVAKQIHELLPGSRWAIFERYIVFLLSMPDEDTSFWAEGAPLAEYLAANGLAAAVSDRFSNLMQTREQYKKALKAHEIAGRLGSGETIFRYPDYRIFHVGAALQAGGNLREFIHPAVLRIAEHDHVHNTHFLDTLEMHLKYMDNPTKAAAELFIHRNTLFYRVAKAKELFQISLADGEERLQVHLSIKFLRLLQCS